MKKPHSVLYSGFTQINTSHETSDVGGSRGDTRSGRHTTCRHPRRYVEQVAGDCRV
jgi:hypothetical protein